MIGEIHVDVASSLRSVEPAEWDALKSAAGFYTAHTWLLSDEADPSADVSYLIARDGNGALMGGLPYYRPRVAGNERYNLRVLLERDDVPRSRALVLAGARSGYRCDVPVSDRLAPADTSGVRTRLLREAAERAGHDDRQAVLLYVPGNAYSQLAADVGSRGAPVDSDATIALPDGSFADWLGELPKKQRTSIRRELKAYDACGWRTEVVPLGAVIDDVVPLVAALQEKHGARGEPRALARLLARQEQAFGDRAIAFVGRLRGQIGAFALAYRHGDALYIRMVGLNYDLAPEAAYAYFNIMYYAPISHAYATGARALHLGVSSLLAKVRRGARLTSLWALPIGWAWPDDVVDGAVRRVTDGLRAEIGERAAAHFADEADPLLPALRCPQPLTRRHETNGS
ncbi:GNAT family N-acetyltransferase [Actinomadura sp. DC4]|uniref:GNAT family N-acetyltransferase n=1 Tax=Actinomadura sp. DC4 TaxID=3055069 RepID=UPI0025AF8E4F|nr:GNAT family N-acetyltransferase [Actinomadura sp. DC4]MDN3358507.1 GNAT family N-acetyltransferase [Actinomadura sp. DC4]